MPALVGGFGNFQNLISKNFYSKYTTCFLFLPFNKARAGKNKILIQYLSGVAIQKFLYGTFTLSPRWDELGGVDSIAFGPVPRGEGEGEKENLGSYLAGLIEGDGTFAVHSKNSTAKKYRPMIIVVFKKEDFPLAEYLKNLTNCGNIQIKENRGYVLWQIGAIAEVHKIINLINGKLRTPKIDGLNRSINWINDYICKNKHSKLPSRAYCANASTQSILDKINKLDKKSIDNSPIDSNAWLSGFSDSDSNFSINITKRSNGNARVQLYYRLEIKQTYHKLDAEEISFFAIMSKISLFLRSNLLSRTRVSGDKKYYSFICSAFSKESIDQINYYFSSYPLLSSKRLDYLSWYNIIKLQRANPLTITYLKEALEIRKDFNSTRTTFNWNHLKKSYLEN